MDDAEQIQRDFAAAWGRIGAAWGVAPSTAAVQGYLLVHGGPLTEAEIRRALGLSHKAAFTALVECEAWGLIASTEPRRSGRRGPPGRAWEAVDDHWEWFRRVCAARKKREADPVLPILHECLRRARAAGEDELGDRVARLVEFTHEFDRGLSAVVRSDSSALEHMFGVLGRLDDDTLDSLLGVLAMTPEDELAEAARSLARVRPAVMRRLLALIRQPGLARLLQ
jgi:DNA-binding transcriptional regulator GbsR (MarR family)